VSEGRLVGTVALVDWVFGGDRVGLYRRSAVESVSFVGYRFPPDVILLAVCWYLRYGLSYRDVAELLAERGITVDALPWAELGQLRCGAGSANSSRRRTRNFAPSVPCIAR
jgi:hypothetical protein